MGYENQSQEFPFGDSAESFKPLKGWANRKAAQPNQGYGIALPLEYFGGGDELLANETRPFFISTRSEEDREPYSVFQHYFDGLSIGPKDVAKNKLIIFSGDPRKSSMYYAGTQFETPITSKDDLAPSEQMFFAQRVIPSKFKTWDDFYFAAIHVLTEPAAVHALLNREDINPNKFVLVSRLLEHYKEVSPVLLDEVILGHIDFPKIALDERELKYLFEALVPEQTEDLARHIGIATGLVKGFCSEKVFSDDEDNPVLVATKDVSQETLAKGIALLFSTYDDRNYSQSTILKAIPKIKEVCGDACDKEIASYLTRQVDELSWRLYNPSAKEIDVALNRLSIEAQNEFYESMFEQAAFIIGNTGYAKRHGNFVPLIYALRGASNGLELSDAIRLKFIEYLGNEELAFGLSANPDTQFVGEFLAQQAFEARSGYSHHFIFNGEDWTHGTQDQNYRAQVALEFTRAYCARLTAQHLIQSGEVRGDLEKEVALNVLINEMSRQTGITTLIKDYGKSLGTHKEANKLVIDYLFANGNAKDQLELANKGCLDPKVAKRVIKNYGDQFFGNEARKALEGFAEVLADDTDRGTGRMESYLRGLVNARRDPNGDEYRRTRLDRPGTPKFVVGPRSPELPAPVRTFSPVLPAPEVD